MAAFDARGAALTEALQEYAGINPREDAINVGYIRAVKDLLNVELEETQ